ncbi:uncharacterized protein LOC135693363 [Rhopilema esculentum]|uniref:uncharacterized protein LOC135693363 n=1 Tax=Rhopilema esculentum TaxID=499914 RepID=UPI0031D2AE64
MKTEFQNKLPHEPKPNCITVFLLIGPEEFANFAKSPLVVKEFLRVTNEKVTHDDSLYPVVMDNQVLDYLGKEEDLINLTIFQKRRLVSKIVTGPGIDRAKLNSLDGMLKIGTRKQARCR